MPTVLPSLIVFNSRGATLQGRKLVLVGVTSNAIIFADRPARSAGHDLTAHIVEDWSKGSDNFTKDPPNATVSAFRKDGIGIKDAVVVLKNPKLEGDQLTFDVDVLVIAVPADSAANTIPQLLDLWKSKPGGLNIGSAGFGSPAHFNSVILSLDNALPITMVQYRGSYPLTTDLISSRIDMAMISYIVAQPFIQARKIKILAQDGATRWSGMPDMPTMIESGQLKKKASGWYAVSAPAGTPKAIVDRLNSEFIMASREPRLAARLQESGVLTKTATPEELRTLMRAEVEIVRPLVKSLGMAPN
jgi:hypothetical protein